MIETTKTTKKTTTVTEDKEYELRGLCSKDVFPMMKIISKIGVKEFKSCFDTDDVKSLISGGEGADASAVGLAVLINISGVVMDHIPDCEAEIYQFLTGLSGISKKDLENLPMNTFIEMIIDVFKKEEFKDFMQVVSKLFK